MGSRCPRADRRSAGIAPCPRFDEGLESESEFEAEDHQASNTLGPAMAFEEEQEARFPTSAPSTLQSQHIH